MRKLSRFAMVFLGGGCLWASLACAESQWMISPQAVDLHLTRSVVKTFTVANQGTTPLRIAISPIYYPVGTVGPFAQDVALIPDANQNSLVPYMKVSPAQFIIPPGGSRLVRLAITLPNKKLATGTYRGYVRFHEIPSQVASAGEVPGKGVSTDIGIAFDQVAGIYANVGANVRAANLSKASIDQCHIAGSQLVFDVKNPTVWKFSPIFTVATTNDKALAQSLRIVAVMPASSGTRTIPLNSVASADAYQLTWSLGKETLGQTACTRA